MHAVIETGEALPITVAWQRVSCTVIPMRGLMLPVGGHGTCGMSKLQALQLDGFGVDSSSISSHLGPCHQVQRTHLNNWNGQSHTGIHDYQNGTPRTARKSTIPGLRLPTFDPYLCMLYAVSMALSHHLHLFWQQRPKSMYSFPDFRTIAS